MIRGFQSLFKIPELKSKILYSFGGMLIFRILGHIPVLKIDTSALMRVFSVGDWLELIYALNFAGIMDNFGFLALGPIPYITASQVVRKTRTKHKIDLLNDKIESMSRESADPTIIEELRIEKTKLDKRLSFLTYIGAGLIALPLSLLLYQTTWHFTVDMKSVEMLSGILSKVYVISSFIVGALITTWTIELISKRGFSNGYIWILLSNIYSYFLSKFFTVNWGIFDLLFYSVLCLLLIGFAILMSQGTRKIPVQYAKRVVGRKIYGGQSTHIPLKFLNTNVFQTVLQLYLVVATFIAIPDFLFNLADKFAWYQVVIINFLSFGSISSYLVFFLFYTLAYYFYIALSFNPIDVADNMKRHGGFIPGVRPGRRTAEFIDLILLRITFASTVFMLVFFVMIGLILFKIPRVPGLFSPLIIVYLFFFITTSNLDMLQELESHLLMRHYDGFMKGGKIKGRRRF